MRRNLPQVWHALPPSTAPAKRIQGLSALLDFPPSPPDWCQFAAGILTADVGTILGGARAGEPCPPPSVGWETSGVRGTDFAPQFLQHISAAASAHGEAEGTAQDREG